MTVWRSLFIVASACISLATAHAAPSVAIDLSRLDASDAAALEQALVTRLLQEGFAIDPLTAEPAIVVAVASHDRELVLSAKSPYFERSRTINISGASGAQLQLELVQKVVELARLAREAAPPPSVATARQPDQASTVGHAVVEPEREPRWQLGVDVGVATSGTIEASLQARYALRYGLGVMLRGGAAEPDAPEISVGEQDLLAGASYELPIANRLALDVALLAGALRHHFELAMPLGERAGTRFDAATAMPVRISMRLWRGFEVSAWGIAKLARELEHTSGGAVLWHRDALGVVAGAGVAARF